MAISMSDPPYLSNDFPRLSLVLCQPSLKARHTPRHSRIGHDPPRLYPERIVSHVVPAADIWPRRRGGIAGHPPCKGLGFSQMSGTWQPSHDLPDRLCLMKGVDDEGRGAAWGRPLTS
jgi:hypothetical protein